MSQSGLVNEIRWREIGHVIIPQINSHANRNNPRKDFSRPGASLIIAINFNFI